MGGSCDPPNGMYSLFARAPFIRNLHVHPEHGHLIVTFVNLEIGINRNIFIPHLRSFVRRVEKITPRKRKKMKTDVYEEKAGSQSRTKTESGSWKSDASKEEMMKKMEAAGTPGPAHHALDALVGDWKAEVKCWIEPGGSPEVTQGTAKAKWILNGHFLEEEFHGQMMGKPFSGRTLLGFDNTKQTFNSAWVSDSQTSMFVSEGTGDGGNKVITLEGNASCPASGRNEIPMKTVLRLSSRDKHVLEMYDGSEGRDTKTMEIIYTRQ
jgi:hypothetical protein